MTSVLATLVFAFAHIQPGLLTGDKQEKLQVIVTFVEQPTAEDIKAVEELPATLVRKLPLIKAAVFELRRGQVEAAAQLKRVKSIHRNGGVSPGLPPQNLVEE